MRTFTTLEYLLGRNEVSWLPHLPRRREVGGVELHVSVRQEYGLHAADTQQTVAHAAAKLVDGLRFERRVNVAVLVVHLGLAVVLSSTRTDDEAGIHWHGQRFP